MFRTKDRFVIPYSVKNLDECSEGKEYTYLNHELRRDREKSEQASMDRDGGFTVEPGGIS